MSKQPYDPAKRRAQYLRNKEASNRASRAWYAQNKARHKVLRERWRDEHPGYFQQKNKEWYYANPERQKERGRAYAAAHLPELALKRRKRRSIIAGAAGFHTLQQLEDRMAYYGHVCSYCGGPFEEVDHVIALANGGPNWAANLRPACKRCNRSKGTWPLAEFLRRLPALLAIGAGGVHH